MLREATLGKTTNTQLLSEAEKSIERLAAEPGNANMLADYRALANFAMARLQPEKYLQKQVQTIKPLNDIGEITASIDALLDSLQQSKQADQSVYTNLPDVLKKNQMLDWVMTFQSTDDAAKKHAVDRWKETQSVPWLVAAIARAGSDDEYVNALISAAEHILC